MNLLLLQPAETEGSNAVIYGRRVHHIHRILKKGPGEFLRAGVIGQGECQAEILTLEADRAEFSLGPITSMPRPRVHVVVALPRPKALSRLVATAASFGLRSLILINAWRVEKSYFASPRLDPQRVSEDVLLGCEQGAQVWCPEIHIFRKFVSFLEEGVPGLFPEQARKFLLHPSAIATLDQVLPATPDKNDDDAEEIVLVFGPEGGFVLQEVQSLRDAGFLPVRINAGPLKTEVALAATLGQLLLLRPFVGGRTVHLSS